MLGPGLLCSGSPASPTRIRGLPYLIGANLIISRVTLTTPRRRPPFHHPFARTCIKQSDQGASCMDTLAFSMSLSLFDPPSTHVDRFHWG